MTSQRRILVGRRRALLRVVLSISLMLGSTAVPVVGQENAESEQPRLSLRSHFGEFVVSEDRQLGTFAIDLGVPFNEDNASAKIQYVMERVFAAAVDMAVQRQSNYQCDLSLLVDQYYPFVLGFLYKGRQAPADPGLRETCVDIFKWALTAIGQDDVTVLRALRELERRAHSKQTARGDSEHPKNPILAVIDGIREFERWVYADGTTMHAIVGIEPDDYAAITLNQFRSWLTETSARGAMRFVSDDPALLRLLGDRASDQVPTLPIIHAPKRSGQLVRFDQFESSSIRAAVFVAIDPPKGGTVKIANDVTRKFCRESHVAVSSEQQNAAVNPRCMADGVLGREYWLGLYFGADDGSDPELFDRVTKIAQDPSVIELAAQRTEGVTPGHPYIAIFGAR
jgi:hypothetical protein